MLKPLLVWLIAAGVTAGILFRPKKWPEAVWAVAGAVLLTASGLVSPPRSWTAVRRGTDVYLFLAGMMLLAEMARTNGVFEWLAAMAVAASRGSRKRLFALIYAVGTAVTALLSNDATAVVLTPAVYAAVERAGAPPMPYLLICAFVANAASFVLPVSNPANLVVYGKDLPPLGPWLRTFALPSLSSIALSFFILRWLCRRELEGKTADRGTPHALSAQGRRAAWGLTVAGAVLLTASAVGHDLGLPVFAAAAAVAVLTSRFGWKPLREIVAGVSWSVLPLVAGLFVLVEALAGVGVTAAGAHALEWCGRLGGLAGRLVAAFGVAGLSNVMNNLPSGLLAGQSIALSNVAGRVRAPVMIRVDLGPNLSVTGSLATILWLIALRREGQHVSAWTFLKAGLLMMPAALALAVISLSF